MRKQNKIVSLVLVLALLLGVFVIVPGAPVVKASAADDTAFTPSATWDPTAANANGVLSSVDGNMFTSAPWANWDNETIAHNIVTTADGDKYLTLVATADKTTANHFVNVTPTSQPLDFNGYYVIDLDVASESDFIERFSINPVIRSSKDKNAPAIDPYTTLLSLHLSGKDDGQWHHYTIVGDLANNVMYIYVDGRYVTKRTTADGTDPVSGAYKGTYAAATADGSYYLQGVRINIGANVEMNVGDSISFDNLTARTLSANTELAAALAANNLSAWSGAITAPTAEKLPAVATVDGVEYSNVNDINAALDGGYTAKQVELQRQFAGTVTVNCDATVDTNGCLGTVVAGANVSSSPSGTVTTYDAPFKKSVSMELVTSNAAAHSVLKADVQNNLFTSYYFQQHVGLGDAFTTDAYPSLYAATNAVDGSVYAYRFGNSNYNKTASDAYNQFGFSSSENKYDASAPTYFVIDFDVARESTLTSFSWTLLNKIGSTGGASSYGSVNLLNVVNRLPENEFHHITVICESNSNVCYVYVDGVFANEKGTFQAEANVDAYKDGTNALYFIGMRIAQDSPDTFMLDNVAARRYADADGTIASLVEKGSTIGWSDAITAPATSYPPIASVDGEYYYSAAQVSTALISNGQKKVEILGDVTEAITVTSDAYVNTNGCTVTLNPGEGVTKTDNGDGTYTFNAPYIQSVSKTEVKSKDNSTVISEIKSDATGNLFGIVTNNAASDIKGNNNPTTGSTAWLVTNTITGDKYFEAQTTGTPDNNYFEVQAQKNITPNENTQFVVVEMDATVFNGYKVSFSPIARVYNTGTGIWGAGAIYLNDILADYSYGEMQHVTAVFNLDTNDVYIFANGTLEVMSTENAYTSNANHTANWVNGAGVRFDGIRLGSTLSTGGGFAVDNVNIQYFEEAASGYAADSLSAAMAASDLTVWANANTEVATQLAPLATVDGEYVYSVVALNEVLNGRYAKKVELLRDESANITVNCSATVETNGLAVNLVAGSDIASSSTDDTGTVTTYVAKWKSSVISEVETTTNGAVSGLVASNAGGSVGSVMLQNWNASSVGYYTVTPAEGDVYGKLVANASATTGNHYVSVHFTEQVLDFTNDYYVIELDVAAEGDAISNFSVNPIITWNGSAGSGDRLDSNPGLYPARFGINDGNWHHFALVAEMSTNTLKVYVDGELVATKANQAYNSANYKAGTEYWVSGIRFNIGGNVAMDVGSSISIDNFSFKTFSSASDVSYGTTAAEEKLPSIATVNGVEYSSLDTLTAALSEGKNLNVSLDRAVNGAAYASTTATVTTNGLANFIKGAGGYTVEDNGDGTYTVKVETRMGTITVKVNGINAISADVLFGTDIAEYLNLNNSYVFDIISGDNGQVYTGAAWDVTPSGVVDGDEVYNVTATKATDAIVVRDSSGTAVAVTDLATAIAAKVDYTIVMNSDYEFSKNSVTPSYVKDVYMAGHTITFAASSGGVHAFVIGPDLHALNFIDGSIVDDVRSTTQAVFFCQNNFVGEIECVNVNLYAVADLLALRSGTFTFDNCNITMLECQNGYGIQVAEHYNASYPYTKCVLNLIDSNVQYTHFTEGRTQAFITYKAFTDWSWKSDYTEANKEADKEAAIAAGADKFVHEINISGCKVNISFGASLFSASSATAGNCNVSVDNTQLNVKNLYGTLGECNFVIGDNVYSAVPLSGVDFADGIVQVNSGNPEAPYAYVNDYATVTWEGGTTERWADGTYPVAGGTYVVEKVEAGKFYTFAKGTPDISMKVNLSLDTNLKLNVYVSTATNLTAFNIAGVEYSVESADVVTIDGVQYYHFAYEIAPYYAAGTMSLAATVGETTYTRTINLVQYAELVEKAYADNAGAKNLVKAILQYVVEASEYMGAYHEGYTDVNSYADADAVTLPTEGVNTMSNVNAYLASAALDLSAAPKWAFALAGGDISDLVITVDGVKVEYTVSGGYVYVELPAYDMLKTLTVKVGGVSGEFNFAAYYLAQNELATALTDPSTTLWQARTNIIGAKAYASMNLLEAFYVYASYAAAYNA